MGLNLIIIIIIIINFFISSNKKSTYTKEHIYNANYNGI